MRYKNNEILTNPLIVNVHALKYKLFVTGLNNVTIVTTMKERRNNKIHLWQIVLFLVLLLSMVLVWQVLNVLEPESHRVLPITHAYVTHLQPYNYTHPLHLLGGGDYNTIVNYTFKFGLLSAGCDDNTFLLVLVHSSPTNRAKRNCIRNTWGSNQTDWKLFFVMGQSDTIQHHIEKEQQEYGDIIQGSFEDTYRNLTLKHITTLKYAIYHCPKVKYILKTDDDVLVNSPLMNHFLTKDLSRFGTSELLFCNLKKSASVIRTYRSKWRVGFEEYPYKTYPPYCPGWAILYSPDVAFKLYRSAQKCRNPFWIDDVLMTGILAAKNNISHTNSEITIMSADDQKKFLNEGVYPKKAFVFGRPDLRVEQIEKMWRMMVVSNEKPISVFFGRF